MHHPDHHGGGCPKCVINMRQIAVLARLLAEIFNLESARVLAATAQAAAGMHDALGIKAARTTDDTCEHAVTLVSWIRDPKLADEELMTQWTSEIFDDITELVGGEVDPHHGEGG